MIFLTLRTLVHCFLLVWLRWVFAAESRLSLVGAVGGFSSSRCTGFSLQWVLWLWSVGSRLTGEAYGLQ